MKDSQDRVKAVTAWDNLKQWIVDEKPIEINCVNFDYRSGTLVIQPNYKHILQEALSLIGKDDRDYSGDNTDHDSKIFLVASSTACNELRQELRNKFNDKYKED